MHFSEKSLKGISRLSKERMAINILQYSILAECKVNTYEHKKNWIYKYRILKSRCIMKKYRNFKWNTICNYTPQQF